MEDVVNYSGETADGPHGFLSNRALIGFTIDGRQWPSVEHYFQVLRPLSLRTAQATFYNSSTVGAGAKVCWQRPRRGHTQGQDRQGRTQHGCAAISGFHCSVKCTGLNSHRPTTHTHHRTGRDRSKPLRKDWEEVKERVAEEAIRAKFEQNAEERAKLLATKGATLIQRTRNDAYWGIPESATLGENKMGKILMLVRDELLNAQPTTS